MLTKYPFIEFYVIFIQLYFIAIILLQQIISSSIFCTYFLMISTENFRTIQYSSCQWNAPISLKSPNCYIFRYATIEAKQHVTFPLETTLNRGSRRNKFRPKRFDI